MGSSQGINLTAADTVILHDMDFNPENDKQAEVMIDCFLVHATTTSPYRRWIDNGIELQDRCHRIGQTRPVTVYKLYAEGTVDEDIFHLGERKSQLSKAVLDDERHEIDGDGHDPCSSSPNKRGKESTAKRVKKEASTGGPHHARPDDDRNMISNILQKALLNRLVPRGSQS